MSRGMALPVVCILLVGLAMLGVSQVRGVLAAQRSAQGAELAEQALDAAEAALAAAATRLSEPVTFPSGGCGGGLCANGAAPDPGRYSWRSGGSHVQTAPFEGWNTGHWAEDLGETLRAADPDCPAERCRYLRVVAGGWRTELATSLGLESVMRVDIAADGSRSVRRLSWRLARAR